jgi:hypothetical protein
MGGMDLQIRKERFMSRRATWPASLVKTIAMGAVLGWLVALSVAPAHATAHPLGATSPRAVNLRLSDVPHGFKQATGKFVSNAQMAQNTHTPKAQFDQRGRINGYEAEFDRAGTKGVTFVFGDVYVYKAISGASWDYVHEVQHDLTLGKRIVAPKVGDASTAFLIKSKSGGVTAYVYFIDFRRGTVSALVGASGLAGQVHESDALHYAQIVDGRIRGR